MEQKKTKNLIKKIIYFITFILTIVYLVYRIVFTLPLRLGFVCMFFAIIVLLTELWEASDFFIYYFNILTKNRKNEKIPTVDDVSRYPDVDVFIATLNEYESLVSETIQACKNMKYPDLSKVHIYLCDDGNRKSMKDLAERMEINYITRLTNKDAKSGNYNNALHHTNSPYIVFFDADMAPTSDFLMITMPYFIESKEKMGFVQIPQSFKNPDIFQYRYHLQNDIPFEQEYFYNSLQVSKNNTNSAVFCGTNAVVSRAALEDVNGFATGTISEDIATGMLIENKGYKCLAINTVAAYGNSVDDLASFAKQRSRWARGCIQMGRKYKIFKQNGLSFRQKLEYHSCISYWYFGIRRFIYLITPLLFSIFGINIIVCQLPVFLAFWLPMYVLKRYLIDHLENNERSATWTSIYETIMTPILAKETLKEFLGFGSTKFEVTSKSQHSAKMSKLNLKVLLFHVILLTLNLTGFIISALKIRTSGWSVCLLPLIWTLSNAFYLFMAIIFDLRYKRYNYKGFVPNNTRKYNRFALIKLFK